MTTWTDVADSTTSWTEVGDSTTSWANTSDVSTQWGMFGGLIRLCTEGTRDDLMTEGEIDYIVVSHGEDVEIWTDTSDTSTTWTKISDI